MSLPRRAFRWLRATALEQLGVNAAARRRLDGTRAVVLMYHRVLPRKEAERLFVEPGMYVTPETFRRHLDWLRDSFHPLSLAELVTRLAEGRALPPGAVSISFDDGWRDNHEHALPALVASGLPATVFLATDRVGTAGAFWPDRVSRVLGRLTTRERQRVAERLGARDRRDPVTATIEALKPLGEAERASLLERETAGLGEVAEPERELLDWEEVQQMARAGVEFEAHGASHAILTGLPSEEVARELARCRDCLAERGYGRNALFAYPSGFNDARIRELTAQAGFRAALTTEPRHVRLDTDLLALPRIGTHEDVSATRAGFHRCVPGPD